jgi:rare lipoprotein A
MTYMNSHKILLTFIILLQGILVFSLDEIGEASWYGARYHGRTTASGEPFNMYALTAAHKTLPFGTNVKITNLDNGKTIEVVINDRGPFVEGRIIDLSQEAARRLGFLSAGVARVKIEWGELTQAEESSYRIQLGSFKDLGNAMALRNLLESNGLSPQSHLANNGNIRIYLDNIPIEHCYAIVDKLEELGINDLLIQQL